MQVKEIKNSVPFQKYDENGERRGMAISKEAAYMMTEILSTKQVGEVMHATFEYMINNALPNLDQAEYIVFCKILMDNDCIVNIDFRIPLYG